ncbi:MAG TPA: HAD-IIIC family phosphatase, partial [Candidatus Ruminococcus gallistercoris]|nr:HAD-IIIC family phosphatase [Candidatus Ruminococcus gallistercoris]
MTELEYPFDASCIIQKRRSIRRTLLADGTPRIQKRIAVLGGSTTSDIVKTLELFLLNAGIEPTFYESEYAQYFQDAMFPDETLRSFKPDIVFIHTSNRNVTNWPEMTDSAEAVDAKLRAETEKFTAMWRSIQEKFHCPIIQNNFEMPFYRLLGNRDAWDIHGRTNFLTRLNDAFYAFARENESFYINDLNYISADYGLKEWSNPLFWNMYKYAMCFEAIPAFAFSVSNIIKSIFGKNKKALALDLDNTLWGGVVGDDGVDGIEIGQETGVSQSYYEFQSYVKQLKSIGIVLTVCSKNDRENAIAGLNHPEGALKPDDFIVIKANWENKDRNIAETAAELNILPDSIVFADDNPAEREIVRTQIKGAAVPEMDGVENYITTIDRSGFFEVTSFSEDDLKRNEMYKKNALRAAEMASFGDYGDYLRSLEMHAVIDDFLPVYIARITQLTNKSNQFNVTTKRYTPAEMEATFESPDYIRLYGKLIDKFGDNGVVSVVIGRKNGKTLDIELWLMSCRVLKRDMELAMLDRLVERCREAGIETIRGYYYPTAKNNMVRGLFDSFGFEKVSEDADGSTVWQLA